jgi:hypothetical protein
MANNMDFFTRILAVEFAIVGGLLYTSVFRLHRQGDLICSCDHCVTARRTKHAKLMFLKAKH